MDNSHYLPGTNKIAFGEGNVDDAEDVDVILHEYGHAIQHDQISGSFGYELDCISQGFGDYWAGSYSASISTWEKDFVFTWDAGITPSGSGDIWEGRRLDENYTYEDYDILFGEHNKGKIWSATLWDIFNELGRTTSNKLVIQSHYYLNNNAIMLHAANAILSADMALNNGLNMSSLTNILEARDFDVPPAPPQNLTGVCDRNPILQWDDNTEPDLDCYYVYEKVHISEWSLAGSTQNNHYNPESVFLCDPPAYNFSFYVRARDESSRLSNPSDTVSFMAFVKQIAEGQAEDYLSGMVPEAYALYPAHPNPFNPSTSIEYDLSEASRVSLVIYDIMGREVIRWEGLEEVGYRQVVWDGKDQGGRSVPAGIYLYRFTATSVESDKRFTASRKMVLLK